MMILSPPPPPFEAVRDETYLQWRKQSLGHSDSGSSDENCDSKLKNEGDGSGLGDSSSSEDAYEESPCESPLGVTTMGAQTQSMRMRLAFGVIVRLFLPLINGMAKRWQGIRSIKVLRLPRTYHANRSLFTNLFAHAANQLSMSLSSVQVVHRIDPWLKKIKFRRPSGDRITTNSTGPQQHNINNINNLKVRTPSVKAVEDVPADKSVTLDVLYEPPKNVPIRGDVIFIHGLHGSLVNTWKQGLWNSEGKQEMFDRPPRPPVRPPKRPRHSRRLDAPHQFKRPRSSLSSPRCVSPEEEMPFDFSLIDSCLSSSSSGGSGCSSPEEGHIDRDMTYYCDEPETQATIDELEYSFPTFRTMVPEELELGSGHSWMAVEDRGGKGGKRKKGGKTEDWSACWPRDWLSKRFPDLRVIALNYTTDPYLWRPLWIKKRNRTSLAERSREMTDMLIEKGVGVGHPIVWVGHSKGGIFIKQIIVDAWESGRVASEPLWQSSRGTFFYSVPHRGSPLADFNLPLLRQSVELLEIRKNCPIILDLHRRFVALYHKGHLKIKVFSFVETALTLMSVLYLRIVGVDSADPGIGNVCGVHLDHREICKPRSQQCILFLELVKMIESVSL